MKKLCMLCAALLLALTLTVCAAADTVVLDTLADGCQITLEANDSVALTPFAAAEGVTAYYAVKGDLAPVMISIAADDLADGRSMADLTEEEMEELRAIAGDQFAAPKTALAETPSGAQYLCVYEEDQPVWSVFTLYEGYFIELVQSNPDVAELTQEDADFCLSLLYGIWIVPAGETVPA